MSLIEIERSDPSNPEPYLGKSELMKRYEKLRAENPSLSPFEAAAKALAGNTIERTVETVSPVIGEAWPPFNLEELGAQWKTNKWRFFNTVVDKLLKLFNLPNELLNALVAGATSELAEFKAPQPAAMLGSLFLGFPHGHRHPPSLVPPNTVPVPLPSMGSVAYGCPKVLINGLPAARAGDFGLSPTCFSFYPIFKVTTGSSKVFIGGNRAARCKDRAVVCDKDVFEKIEPVPAAVKAIGGVGALLGIQADKADAASATNPALAEAYALSASMATVQQALDLTVTVMMDLYARAWDLFPDAPAGPFRMSGGKLASGSPNVLIGGFSMKPLPNYSEKAVEWLIGGGVRRIFQKLSSNKNPGLSTVGDPVDVVTGAVIDSFQDCRLPGLLGFEWKRHYRSDHHARRSVLGRGFRHSYQHELKIDLDGFSYTMPEGETVTFPLLSVGQAVSRDGLSLSRIGAGEFELRVSERYAMDFEIRDPEQPALLRRCRSGDRSLEVRYDRSGRMASITDGHRHFIRFIYNGEGFIRRVILLEEGGAEREIASYHFDDEGCLRTWTDALGRSGHYAYDGAGRLVRRTDRRGYAFVYQYDAAGRCTLSAGEDGLHEVRLHYRPTERLTQVTYASGGLWQYFYDEDGTILQRVDPYGGCLVRSKDDRGRVHEEVDASGACVGLLYTDCGRHCSRQDALGQVSSPRGEQTGAADSAGYLQPQTSLEWENGHLLEPCRIDPLGEAPQVGALADLMDVAGVASSVALVLSEPVARWDCQGQLIEWVAPGGAALRWRYDAEGEVVERTDGDGAKFRFQRTPSRRRRKVVDPLGNSIRYEYDDRERLIRVVDAGGVVTEYSYDLKDRLVRVARHGSVREEYRYDSGDNLTEKRDGLGAVLFAIQPGPNHLKAVERLSSGEEHRFVFDSRGRVVRMHTRRTVSSFEYDSQGRRTLDARDGRGVAHRFEERQLSETTLFDRFRTSYSHSADGLAIKDPTGAEHRFRWSRDGWLARHLPNGGSELSLFDLEGRCRLKVLVQRGNHERVWRRRYHWSAEGDLIKVEDDLRGDLSYRYDPAHRLISEQDSRGRERSWLYDSAGNLLEQPGMSGVGLLDGNRLHCVNGGVVEYDGRNHLSKRRTARGENAYEYDSRDMLIGIDTPGGRWTAAYDPLGRRQWKCWQGARTEFYWDTDRLGAEVHPDGRLRVYVYTDAIALVPFMFIDYEDVKADPVSGQRYYISVDQRGAPLEVIDDQGAVAWKATLDPYGRVVHGEANRIDLALRFPGHYHDPETDLHYNRFRYYSPELGRYLQSDPLGLAGGLNVYAYPASPLGQVDLRGLHASSLAGSGLIQGEAGPDMECIPRDSSRAGVPSYQTALSSASSQSVTPGRAR